MKMMGLGNLALRAQARPANLRPKAARFAGSAIPADIKVDSSLTQAVFNMLQAQGNKGYDSHGSRTYITHYLPDETFDQKERNCLEVVLHGIPIGHYIIDPETGDAFDKFTRQVISAGEKRNIEVFLSEIMRQNSTFN